MAASLLYKSIPVIALRGIVVFPALRFHFEVGRPKSIAALERAMGKDELVFLITQRDISKADPVASDLYRVGVIARVLQVSKDKETGNYKVVVEALHRAVMTKLLENDSFILCDAKEAKSLKGNADENMIDAVMRSIKAVFDEFVTESTMDVGDFALRVLSNDDPGTLADDVANTVLSSYEDRQVILEELDIYKRLETLYSFMKRELEILRCEVDIEKRTEFQMDKSQREYYLREKMRVISSELGDAEEPMEEVQKYKDRISKLSCDDTVREKLNYECSKLAKLQGGSVDASVIRVYLDTALSIPFGEYTKDSLDLKKARKKLDDDHYGLEKIKERFIELLAIKARVEDVKGQIICLVGPPGVGKTSIVRSVAEAMGRKYVRLSLGGVSDEAEIRGHRKTYVGAMPGRITNALIQAKSMNPVVLLDEIDKLGKDYKGDPASAMLEVLDPEQNNTFRDNYLEFPTDLSKVLFITTANDTSTIPQPLFDRMEIIELSSYTPEEKLMIAKNHLVKKQLSMHGLNGKEVRFTDKSLRYLIDRYTREAGVRRLEQLIAALCRKCAVRLSEEQKRISVTETLIQEFLGPEKFSAETIDKTDSVGVVNGLAWTSVGGTMLQIETVTMPGSGKLELTGSLGDVMKESARTALSYIRSVAEKYGIDSEVFEKRDIHIHAPEGAVPKDGPSAGVTMATALLSALTGRKVNRKVAMTGEISLTGRVMKIGGLKEKSMAAYKAGVKTVIIPKENEPDLWEIDSVIKENVSFLPVTRLDEVFAAALQQDIRDGSSTVKFTPGSIPNTRNSGRRRIDEI
ncbi:MAG: endopeptidase La [Oscillospiraceae bacterium]|nr:endopeptidase La [Oscillospiraceae bacterium]